MKKHTLTLTLKELQILSTAMTVRLSFLAFSAARPDKVGRAAAREMASIETLADKVQELIDGEAR